MSIETQDEVLEQEEIEQPDEKPEGEIPEGEQPDAEQDDGDAASDGEVVIGFGDEMPPAENDDEIEGKPAPAWVKELRQTAKDLKRRNKELEQAEAARQAAAAPKEEDVGSEPQPEDFEYDSKAYGVALVAWEKRKDAAEAKAKAARKEQETAAAAWTAKRDAYNTAKVALKVSDFDVAEDIVSSTMDQTQQAILLKLPKPEQFVYAIGKNPARAKELAAIKDPIDFAFAVAKLETQLKVQPKNSPPAAERRVTGSAGATTAVSNELARLQAEADKSGDRSKVAAYLRKQKQTA